MSALRDGPPRRPSAPEAISSFKVSVSDDVLNDLRQRLSRVRWPASLAGADWDTGTPQGFMDELVDYWNLRFDWRMSEAKLNRWPQYTTVVDGQRIHFVHVRARQLDAIPLVLMHGWPSSAFEHHHVIGPLSNPAAFGAPDSPAFHVVCVSLPGFGWSGPTVEPGWDTVRMATAVDQLLGRLGYATYVAQGGDVGAVVARHLAQSFPDRTIGIHLSMVPTDYAKNAADVPLTVYERAELEAYAGFVQNGTGYQAIQRTKPGTLGFALSDSPAGLAAWIVEKFQAWTELGVAGDARITMDELLTNITTYWVTNTIESSIRVYYESALSGASILPDDRIEVPTGCAVFPGDIMRPSRRWAERHYNVVHWTRMPRGGHFAAWEEPELLVDDVRRFASGLIDRQSARPGGR